MKRGLAIVAGGALLCAVPYLAWLNPTGVDVRLAPHYTIPSMQLGVVLVVAFLAGVSVILFGLLFQTFGRWLREQWSGRRSRRDARGDAMEHRGRALLWAGDGEQGRALLLRAWRRDRSRRRAVLSVVASYLDDGDNDAAERVLLDAVDQHRTDGDLLLALSEVCARRGDQRRAIQTLEQLRALHPHAPRVLIPLRDRYAAVRRWREAADVQSIYLRTLNQSPVIARERDRLVGLEYEAALTTADPSERAQALTVLVDAHPAFVPALVSLGDALISANRGSEAIAAWDRALRHTPRSVLVDCLLRQDSQPAARQHWRQTLRKLRAPSVHPDALQLWLTRLQLLDGQPGEALKQIDAVTESLRATPFAHQLRAEALRQLGRVDQAATEYAAAIVDGPVAPYVCRRCGQSAAKWTGRCPQCGEWDSYRAAVEIATD
ncbi:MAG TPA: tetratricopeptide repeat protein [Candidatus Kryptonia bacterium]|nr:tetratricopeptide repeat protein [Candidatus Kryptonia bacterium]